MSERSFLSHPNLLPTSLRGRPWGPHSLVIDVAGTSYRFGGLSASQLEILETIYGWRSSGAAVETVDSVLLRAEARVFRPLEAIDWSSVIEVDFTPGALRASCYRWMARIEWRSTLRGALWCDSEGEDEDEVLFTDMFENYFRILVAYRLLSQGHLLVHSAAIAGPEGAYLFPGASGDGKTTLSRLALEEGRTVLSDDSNALLHTAAGPRVVALPFGGELRDRRPPTEAYPALGLATLAKSESHRLEALPRSAAVAKLVGCAPFVNGDPHRREALFETAERLTRELPARRLSFAKRGGFWPLLSAARVA